MGRGVRTEVQDAGVAPMSVGERGLSQRGTTSSA